MVAKVIDLYPESRSPAVTLTGSTWDEVLDDATRWVNEHSHLRVIAVPRRANGRAMLIGHLFPE